MYILPTNHVVSMKKFQSKIFCILDAAKKTNLAKFSNHLIGAVGWRMSGGCDSQLRRDWPTASH
jgi:hypothetical protein